MTATTKPKPVYRWEGGPTDFFLVRLDIGKDNWLASVEAVECLGDKQWFYRIARKPRSETGWKSPDHAKAACELALNVTTTQDDQPTPAPRCNVCGWPLVEDGKGGCTAGSCSQRPVPKKQDDQPKTLSWIGEGLTFGVTKDGSKVGFVKYDAEEHWMWHLYRNGNSGFATSGDGAKNALEQAWRHYSQDDQPPVIVPPDGLADALDTHAEKVAEQDAEATGSKVRQSIQESRKKIWGDRIGEAEENGDCHATAIKTAADKAKEIVHGRNGQYGKPERSQERIAKLWSAYLGVELTARQVCGCMTLLKMGRLAGTPDHEDSLVDAIGYLLLYEDCGEKTGVA